MSAPSLEMQEAKIIVVVFPFLALMLLLNPPTFGTVGIGDGCCDTCEGYEVCFGDILQNKAAGPSIVGYEGQVPQIQAYYQYKKHFLGRYREGYFIFNTRDGTLQTFSDKVHWENARQQAQLIPQYWTDWIEPRRDCGVESFFTLMNILFFVLGIPYLLWLGYMVGGYFYPHWKKSRGRVSIALLGWTALIVCLVKLQHLGSF